VNKIVFNLHCISCKKECPEFSYDFCLGADLSQIELPKGWWICGKTLVSIGAPSFNGFHGDIYCGNCSPNSKLIFESVRRIMAGIWSATIDEEVEKSRSGTSVREHRTNAMMRIGQACQEAWEDFNE